MKIQEVRTYEELQGYLREFSNFLGDPTPYDFIGAFHLFLAILDNLAKNHRELPENKDVSTRDPGFVPSAVHQAG
jgi:hypothetical protein